MNRRVNAYVTSKQPPVMPWPTIGILSVIIGLLGYGLLWVWVNR
jgi:hypothetical protein